MKAASGPWPCTEHQYVTDGSGRNVSRACVHCGESRPVSVIKCALGLVPNTPAQTPEQAANAASWAELNEVRQPVAVK